MVDLVSHPPQVPLPPSDSQPVSSAADASHGAGPGDAPPRGRTRPVGRVRTLLSRSVADTRPLSTAAFRRTFVGQSVSVIGLMASSVAVPVELYALTHSSAVVGVSGLVGLVPTVVFGLYGGAVADAVDRRKLYLGSCWLTWIVSLALMVQSLLHVRSPALILILVAVQSGGFAVSSSVRGAIVPRLVPTGQISAANGLLYSVGNLGQVLGPLLAGVLLGLPGGFALVYGADAVLFTVALYAAFRLPHLPAPSGGSAGFPGLRSVADGLLFITRHPVLLMSFLVDVAAMVLAGPEALFPQAAAERFHGGVGPLYSAIAAGALAAGLFSGWIGRVRRQGVALTAAVIVWAVAIAAAGLTRTLWAAIALLALGGAADLVSAVYRQTILQSYVPDHLRGRLQGVHTVVVAGGPRLGDLRAGTMAAVVPLTLAWSASAFACAALVLAAALAVRPFWRYRAETAG